MEGGDFSCYAVDGEGLETFFFFLVWTFFYLPFLPRFLIIIRLYQLPHHLKKGYIPPLLPVPPKTLPIPLKSPPKSTITEGTTKGRTNSANPPAITNFADPIALNPAERANGTVRPSLNP